MNTNSFCSVCGQNMQIKVLNPHCLGNAKAECPYNLPKMIFEAPEELKLKCPTSFKYIPTGEVFDCYGNDDGYYWAQDESNQFGMIKFEQSECEPLYTTTTQQ